MEVALLRPPHGFDSRCKDRRGDQDSAAGRRGHGVSQVLDHVRPGSIVIAHCIGAPHAPATTAAIKRIIPDLRARGYRLVTLARLLAG